MSTAERQTFSEPAEVPSGDDDEEEETVFFDLKLVSLEWPEEDVDGLLVLAGIPIPAPSAAPPRVERLIPSPLPPNAIAIGKRQRHVWRSAPNRQEAYGVNVRHTVVYPGANSVWVETNLAPKHLLPIPPRRPFDARVVVVTLRPTGPANQQTTSATYTLSGSFRKFT